MPMMAMRKGFVTVAAVGRASCEGAGVTSARGWRARIAAGTSIAAAAIKVRIMPLGYGMTAPDANPRESVRVMVARHVLGVAHSWEFPPVADRALSDGLYSDALAEMAQVVNPTMSEVAPLMTRAMTELGLPTPSRSDAAWCVAEHCIRRIAFADEEPLGPLSLLNDVSGASQDVLPNTDCSGYGMDLERLIGIFWYYFEPPQNWYGLDGRRITNEGEWKALLDRMAREESRNWLARRAANAPPPNDSAAIR
jgi:hypothetical protein